MSFLKAMTLKRITWAMLLLLILIAYGFYFPKKYYFNCESDNSFRSTSVVVRYDLITNQKIDAEYRSWADEDLTVKKYFWGLFYTLDYFNLFECGVAFGNEIICTRESNKNHNSSMDDYIAFDYVKSTLSKTWFSKDHKNKIITEYDSSNLMCKKRNTAFD